MLYAAQMLRADMKLKNPTVLVVVDRKDLDGQINDTFGGADIKNLVPVQSCKNLDSILNKTVVAFSSQLSLNSKMLILSKTMQKA